VPFRNSPDGAGAQAFSLVIPRRANGASLESMPRSFQKDRRRMFSNIGEYGFPDFGFSGRE
jgi:hypothetical protein